MSSEAAYSAMTVYIMSDAKLHIFNKEAEKVLSQVRTASFRLILKELIKEYGDIIIFIIIIISGSYLWLWNRHRPCCHGDCSKCANHSVVWP